MRDKRAIVAVSSQTIKDNQETIRELQEELKAIQEHKNALTGPFAEEHLITKGLADCKESQLALKRCVARTWVTKRILGSVKMRNSAASTHNL